MRSSVGLSVVLESRKDAKKVVNKASAVMIKPATNPPSPSSFSRNFDVSNTMMMMNSFLDCCFLCHQKLSPGKDIYMYKGDMAFCSEECRCRQIFMDEDDQDAKNGCTTTISEFNCSLAATSSATQSSSAAKAAKTHRANNNAFAAY